MQRTKTDKKTNERTLRPLQPRDARLLPDIHPTGYSRRAP